MEMSTSETVEEQRNRLLSEALGHFLARTGEKPADFCARIERMGSITPIKSFKNFLKNNKFSDEWGNQHILKMLLCCRAEVNIEDPVKFNTFSQNRILGIVLDFYEKEMAKPLSVLEEEQEEEKNQLFNKLPVIPRRSTDINWDKIRNALYRLSHSLENIHPAVVIAHRIIETLPRTHALKDEHQAFMHYIDSIMNPERGLSGCTISMELLPHVLLVCGLEECPINEKKSQRVNGSVSLER
jgi:hypothetical protein